MQVLGLDRCKKMMYPALDMWVDVVLLCLAYKDKIRRGKKTLQVSNCIACKMRAFTQAAHQLPKLCGT